MKQLNFPEMNSFNFMFVLFYFLLCHLAVCTGLLIITENCNFLIIAFLCIESEKGEGQGERV